MKSGAATRHPKKKKAGGILVNAGILCALKDVGSCFSGTAQPSRRLISRVRRK